MYQKVSSDLNLVSRENEIIKYWQNNDIFKLSGKQREDGEVFTFYDGPPTANGKPHIGHILTRVIKDIIPRYKTMQGYYVLRKAGWDTHGLPVELEVEKLLGIDGKKEIEAYGVEKFVTQCKESVWKYKKEWEDMSERVGFWADMEDPYVTYENNYIESEWWALKQLFEKDLIYKGYKTVPYCPRCGTALSSHEVAQGYKDITETSVFVRFQVPAESDTYFAVWTTTPWTLPSNVAICVNPKENYVKIEIVEDEETGKKVRYWLAEALVEKLFGEAYSILETQKGKDLVGKAYEPLFDYAKDIVAKSGEKAYYVTADDYVTLTDGTGIVHIAPAFGEDDAKVAARYKLPFVQLVNEDGKMSSEVTDFAGVFCKDADKGLIQKLKANHLLIKKEEHEHSYPHCWRCDTPLIYYGRNSWFIAMTKLKDALIRNNKTVNWVPKTIGTGRFGNFLENVVDWSFSRERYWGTPLPIWECSCGHRHMIGSIAELKSMSDNCPEEIELHKPYIDAVQINCPKCQQKMQRVSEVIDCWFDSGSMPFAQWHYPFENQEKFNDNFPAQFISEAQDQTRGWFYTLMAIGTLLFDKSPYENVIVLGLVQDKNGQKMSKHKGNVVDPWQALEEQGADAVRWYFYTNSQPWLPSKFAPESVNEGKRKFLGTLWNTYSFYVLYANIDAFAAHNYSFKTAELSVMDRWVLSRLHTTIKIVTADLDQYDITMAARELQKFTDELSNWYVRRSRERFWQKEMTQDKIHAYLTLYTVLVELTKLAAPFIPFMTEAIYQNLVRSDFPEAPESVHLCDFPQVEEARIDPKLEAKMELILELVSLGRTARNNSNMKIRQPLAKMFVIANDTLDQEDQMIVLQELNIKEMVFVDNATAFQDYQFKPQLRILGKKLGKKLPALSKILAELPGQETMKKLKADGKIEIDLDGETLTLVEEELIIVNSQVEGLATESNNGCVVALETNLSPELKEEGYAREIISKIQTMRKENGYEVTDKIKVYYGDNEVLKYIFEKYAETIRSEVLAVEVKPLAQEQEGRTWKINEEVIDLMLERI